MRATLTRRSFLKGAAAIGLPAIIPSSALGLDGAVAPSNRITMGIIGIGPRGRYVLDQFLKQPDARFLVSCDLQKERSHLGKRLIDRAYGNGDCAETADMFEVFGREDLDAVLIATGDRWHGVGSMIAARHGKDVYSEKPCTMSIAESIELDETFRRCGRLFQAGTQRRSVPNFQLAAGFARDGKLGNLHTVHASITPKHLIREWRPEEEIPEGFDWDRWLGQSPWRPYNLAYLRGGWHGYADFEAGAMFLDWGAHTVDLCQWAAGMDGSAPVEFEPQGPEVRARYSNGLRMLVRIGGYNNEGDWHGLGTCPVRFVGDEGWIEAGDMCGMVAGPESLLRGLQWEQIAGTDPSPHIRDFLDCVKSRNEPVCGAAVTRSSHVAAHAAALCLELGRKLRFDPETESFIDDPEANRLRERARRAPWSA